MRTGNQSTEQPQVRDRVIQQIQMFDNCLITVLSKVIINLTKINTVKCSEWEAPMTCVLYIKGKITEKDFK